jgi:hypothetical protein
MKLLQVEALNTSLALVILKEQFSVENVIKDDWMNEKRKERGGK